MSGASALAKAAAPRVAPTALSAVRRAVPVAGAESGVEVGSAMVRGRSGGGLQAAVRRKGKGGLDQGKLGGVGIVAVDAVIALARSAGEVPKAGHAAMGTVQIITVLGAVTLSAQAHGLLERDPTAVGEAELVVVGGVVAAEAREGTVLVLQTLMEFVEVRGLAGIRARGRGGVAGATRDRDGVAQGVKSSGFDPWLLDGLADHHRVGPRRGKGRGWGGGRRCGGVADGDDRDKS